MRAIHWGRFHLQPGTSKDVEPKGPRGKAAQKCIINAINSQRPQELAIALESQSCFYPLLCSLWFYNLRPVNGPHITCMGFTDVDAQKTNLTLPSTPWTDVIQHMNRSTKRWSGPGACTYNSEFTTPVLQSRTPAIQIKQGHIWQLLSRLQWTILCQICTCIHRHFGKSWVCDVRCLHAPHSSVNANFRSESTLHGHLPLQVSHHVQPLSARGAARSHPLQELWGKSELLLALQHLLEQSFVQDGIDISGRIWWAWWTW